MTGRKRRDFPPGRFFSLRIQEQRVPHNFSFVIPGKLAGMGCPGMISPLDGELLQLKRQNIGAIVSLTEYPLDAATVERLGFVYLHLPLADLTPPTPAQIDAFVAFVREQNNAGRAVCAHCAAGMGRTGTMLACYLVALGESGDEAISSVRAIRPGSIETRSQEQCVRAFWKRRLAAEAGGSKEDK